MPISIPNMPLPLITCRRLIELLAELDAGELAVLTASVRTMGATLLEQAEAVQMFEEWAGEADRAELRQSMLRHLARCVSSCRAYLISYHDTAQLVRLLAEVECGREALPEEVIQRIVSQLRD
ncbi:MAG: hypothetical protein ABIP63_04535 [Thermoanaerobaculia bacterium]